MNGQRISPGEERSGTRSLSFASFFLLPSFGLQRKQRGKQGKEEVNELQNVEDHLIKMEIRNFNNFLFVPSVARHHRRRLVHDISYSVLSLYLTLREQSDTRGIKRLYPYICEEEACFFYLATQWLLAI